MATDVGFLVRVLKQYKDDKLHQTVVDSGHDDSTAPITRDLLGGSFELLQSQELDLDLQVPSGCEKRLDLKSGKVYIHRCVSPKSPWLSDPKHQTNGTVVNKLEDVNFSSSFPLKRRTLNLFDESSLDLKLVPATTLSSSANYESVCTLDKVRSALERSAKEPSRKRSCLWSSSSSPSHISSSSSPKESQEEESKDNLSYSPVAAGCPNCLLYVLISRSNPKCPSCNSVISLPPSKKPRVDLNMSI